SPTGNSGQTGAWPIRATSICSHCSSPWAPAAASPAARSIAASPTAASAWPRSPGIELAAVVLAEEHGEEAAAAERDLGLLVAGVARRRQRAGRQAAELAKHRELGVEGFVRLLCLVGAAGIDGDELAGLFRPVEALVLREVGNDLVRHAQSAEDRKGDAGNNL